MKNLQITILNNSPPNDQEKHLVARSGVQSKRGSTRLPVPFQARETTPKWAAILKTTD